MRLNRTEIGDLCREERTRLGKTQEELADERISVSTISNIERGFPVGEDTVKYYVEKLRLTEKVYNTLSPSRKQEERTKSKLHDAESLIKALSPQAALTRLEEIEIQTFNKPYEEYIKGRCYFELRNFKNAKKHFQNAIRIYNQNVHELKDLKKTNILAAAENELSRIFYHENDLESALEYVNRGIRSFVESGERPQTRFYLYINKAMYLERLNKDEDAFECIEALEKTIGDLEKQEGVYQVNAMIIVHARVKLSRILYKLKLYKRAKAIAEEGLKIARANYLFAEIFTLHSILGDIYTSQFNYEEAKYHYLTALNFKNHRDKVVELIEVYLKLGKIYSRMNDPKAEEYLKKAVELSRDYRILLVEALNKLGEYYITQKRYEEALHTLQKTLDFGKTKETLFNICTLYKKLGDNTKFLEFAYQYFSI